ncbi:hypothetical protein CH298_13185 [Rhodococcoides fascians]|nr:hypothetical protein CH303_13065 [Rhodococcus fascians]OZF18241.1 hypothetical protein CH298_13185 [Rhodococcus fascians]OZF21692.1 hypothetical protein CH297_13080 [Rhodococcus fascians]OZF67317.1 hypothetical protein CH308_12980 [Rhodococcus fascians]OZF70506.1 hypothetical protein CH307_13175 [Rhodococcus fascians]
MLFSGGGSFSSIGQSSLGRALVGSVSVGWVVLDMACPFLAPATRIDDPSSRGFVIWLADLDDG